MVNTCSSNGCDNKAAENRKTCQFHLDYHLKRHNDRKNKGLCLCGNLLETKTRCSICRTKHKEKSRRKHQDFRWAALSLLGGKCECCGEENYGFLTIDHINGGGKRQRIRDNMQGSGFYIKIAKLLLDHKPLPDKFRILCWNCNCGRAYNNGICPHHKAR